MPPATVRHPGIDRLILIIDSWFPFSQPRIVAPQAKDDFSWPHIEAKGLLCLSQSDYGAPPPQRAIKALAEACSLLSYDDAAIRAAFAREFSTYWNYRVSTNSPPKFLILAETVLQSRDVAYYWCRESGVVVIADDASRLAHWLRNTRRRFSNKAIASTRLLLIGDAPMPMQYPVTGRDVLDRTIASEVLVHASPGHALPIVLCIATEHGQVFAGVVLQSASEATLLHGFRRIRLGQNGRHRRGDVPQDVIRRSYEASPLLRCRTERVDSAWVHGRTFNASEALLRGKRVAVVGCGSLGAAVARMLAQAGVGTLTLIDQDTLASHNTSRHVLGHRFVGVNKARATAQMLTEDFPHMARVDHNSVRFENIDPHMVAALAEHDLIISAGIDLAGDFAIDAWRASLPKPPAHVCSWVEEFAIVGHAVLVLGSDQLRSGFEASGAVKFALTDWPNGMTKHNEAGCGSAFQPHDQVDLSATITLATRLALDTLLGNVSSSCRRVWQGDRSALAKLGGVPRTDFCASNLVRVHPWF